MHYYNDLTSFFLLRKEVLQRVHSQKYEYNTGSNRTVESAHAEQYTPSFTACVFSFHVVSFSNLQPHSGRSL